MILQALVAYYNKLAARGEIPKPGWAKANLPNSVPDMRGNCYVC